MPFEACRERIATYAREGDGDAGRGVEAIARAFKARQRDASYKPGLIALFSGTHEGEFLAEKVWRIHGCFGYAIWHHYATTELFDVDPSPIAELSEQLARHAQDPDAMLRDLMSWVELGDEAALGRLEPILRAAGPLKMWEVGYTPQVSGRLLEVVTTHVDGFAARLDFALAFVSEKIIWKSAIEGLAFWLERHEGARSIPAITPHDASAHGAFAAFYRLAREHRAAFDRYGAKLFASWYAKEDTLLGALGIIDEDHVVAAAGARREPWRIIRAGRLVFTTSGGIRFLSRCSVKVHADEAAARADFTRKLAAKKKTTR